MELSERDTVFGLLLLLPDVGLRLYVSEPFSLSFSNVIHLQHE